MASKSLNGPWKPTATSASHPASRSQRHPDHDDRRGEREREAADERGRQSAASANRPVGGRAGTPPGIRAGAPARAAPAACGSRRLSAGSSLLVPVRHASTSRSARPRRDRPSHRGTRGGRIGIHSALPSSQRTTTDGTAASAQAPSRTGVSGTVGLGMLVRVPVASCSMPIRPGVVPVVDATMPSAVAATPSTTPSRRRQLEHLLACVDVEHGDRPRSAGDQQEAIHTDGWTGDGRSEDVQVQREVPSTVPIGDVQRVDLAATIDRDDACRRRRPG